MATEFYPAGVLQESRALFDQVRAWGENSPGVTLIGGWAVYETVTPEAAQQSRDVDVVLHTAAGLRTFHENLRGWGVAWGTSPKGVPMECTRIGDASKEILIDVFTTTPHVDFFHGHAYDHLKKIPDKGFLPGLEFLLRDKIDTIPLRQGRDAYDKKAKDILDIHHLVFHNREGRLPRDLVPVAPRKVRLGAAAAAEVARLRRPEFEAEIQEAIRWLRS